MLGVVSIFMKPQLALLKKQELFYHKLFIAVAGQELSQTY
jgi:hypothetical protein